MVASSEIGWIERLLGGHVARHFPGDAAPPAGGTALREVLTSGELGPEERAALDEWEEGAHAGRSVGDVLLEARMNAAVRLQAEAMARSLGMEEAPEMPRIQVARARGARGAGVVESLTSAGVLESTGAGLSVSRLSGEDTFLFTDDDGYDALRELSLDPNQTDFVEEGQERAPDPGAKPLTIVQSMHGLDAVEQCIKRALPRYQELADKDPAELQEQDLTGEVLGGKYRVKRRLGKGGFGTVYEAVDEMLGAPVAIKVLNPKAAGHERALEQFLGEAKLLTNLDHPNIVRWITFDKRADGQHYFVMEYLSGEELSEILKREGRLAPERVLHMLLMIVDALRAAHRLPDGSALYHLDLKPQNVFVVSGEPERVKVIDFGISQHVGAEAREAAGVAVMSAPDRPGHDLSATIASQVTPAVASDSRKGVQRARGGTLLYASPEQCKHLAGHPDIDELDGRSDLYSLGVMAFQMLTGEMPFEHLRTPLDAIEAHLHRPPRKPADVGADVPRKLADFVARCLEKDRDKRFADAADAHAALERIANPPSRWPLVAAAAAVLALPAAWWFWPDPDLEPFDVVGGASLFLGPETRAATLDVGKLAARGTRVRFTSDKGGEVLLSEWKAELTADRNIRVEAPEGLQDTVEELAYLEVFGSGKPQLSDVKLPVVFLGSEAWSLADVTVQGWDGEKVLDPEGAELEVSVRPRDLRGDLDFVREVRVALDEATPLVAELDRNTSTRDERVYRLPFERFASLPAGAAASVLHVEVVDLAGGIRKEDVALTLDARPLGVTASLSGCIPRGNDYLVNAVSKPVLAIGTNREAATSFEIVDDAGRPLAVSSEETGAGFELDFSRLTGAASGSIRVHAEDGATTHHRDPGRGIAGTRLRFEYQTDVPVVTLSAGPDARPFAIGEERGFVTSSPRFELDLQRNPVQSVVRLACRGRTTGALLEEEVGLRADSRKQVVLALPADDVYDLEARCFRWAGAGAELSDEPEHVVTSFVVLDRTPASVRLSGPAQALVRAGEAAAWKVELGLTDGGATTELPALPVDVSWELRRGDALVREGTLRDRLPGEDPIALGWEDLGLAQDELADGRYELSIGRAQDAAGNAAVVEAGTATWEIDLWPPKIDFVRPRDGLKWDPSEYNTFQLRVDVSDPNGVQQVTCRIGPTSAPGERTEPVRLEAPASGSSDTWRGSVDLPPAWSERKLRLELTARDAHQVEKMASIDVDVPAFGLRRPAVIALERTDAPGAEIARMRLIEGQHYVFGGQGDSLERQTFRNDYSEDPSYFVGDKRRSWEHVVDIEPYYLDETEVTVGQFRAFVEAASGYADARNWKEGETPQAGRRGALAIGLSGLADELPVSSVDWYEASAYARWAGKRLPAFEEWECAVRGGTKYRPHSFARPSGVPEGIEVNVDVHFTGGGAPWPVRRGEDVTPDTAIRDLCSNVSEWTLAYEPPAGAVARAGAYAAGASYASGSYLFTVAARKSPETRSPSLGFRCALSEKDLLDLMGKTALGALRVREEGGK